MEKKVSKKEAEMKNEILKDVLADTFGQEVKGFIVAAISPDGEHMAMALSGSEMDFAKLALSIDRRVEEEVPDYKEKLAVQAILKDIVGLFK